MRHTHLLRHSRLLCLFILTTFFPAWLSAQTETPAVFDREADILKETNVSWLLNQARRDSLRYYVLRDSAIRIARRYGYPIEGRFEGAAFSLQGFDDAGQLKYHTTQNGISAATLQTNEIHPGGEAGLDLTGSGRRFGVWEVGRTRLTHTEINGRITQADNSSASLDDHANHVCGTMIAAGVNPNAKGMAYQAGLDAYDSGNDLAEMAAWAASNTAGKTRVSNHSYGDYAGWRHGNHSGQTGWHWWGTTSISQTTDYKFGLYNSEARSLDNLVFNAPFYLPVYAAGNDRSDSGPAPGGQHWVLNSANQWVSSTTARQPDGGALGYDCIPTAGNAKNILTVGAVDAEPLGGGLFGYLEIADFSGWGPTDDGRIKPDIVARGVDVFSAFSSSNTAYGVFGGTSMAAPAVTGSLVLLQQHVANLDPGTAMRASALKALVIHTAEQLPGEGEGPNYRSGWGLMNTLEAANCLTETPDPQGRHRLRSRDTLFNNTPLEFTYYHDGSGGFKTTIAWTDPPGPVSANSLNPTTPRLVNDLDVRLVSVSDNTTYSPWRLNPASPASPATKGDNFRDNVEQVFEENLPAGYYRVRVTHKGTLSGGFQVFSTVVSGRSPAPSCAGNTSLNNCNGTITDGSGNNNYTNNLNCTWTINPPNAASVMLNFTAFDTENNYDFVRVYNGINENAPLLGEYSGSNIPPSLTANSGKMHIVFDTDGSQTSAGWSADYACSTGQLSVAPATLNFGATGGANAFTVTANCAWNISNIPFWLSVTPQSGSVSTVIGVNCSANTSQQSRTATVIISGCNGLSQTVTVIQAGCTFPASSTISASGPVELCPGQVVTLTANNVCAGCTVNWSNGQSGPDITVAAAGVYTATVSNACGPSPSSNAITVSNGAAPAAPAISASGSTSLCPGETVTLTANNVCAGCAVNWSNGQSDTSITVAAAGVYIATVSNACGPSPSSNAITVTAGLAPNAPAISASGPTSLCGSETVTLTAANVCAGCPVNWSNGQSGTSITVSAPGTYTATVSNNCGQSLASNAITVTAGFAPGAPAISASGSTSLCPGETVTLTANNVCTGCAVNWSNGQSGTSITVSAPGTYTATVSNICGQSLASNAIAVTAGSAPNAPAISASGPTSLCGSETVTLTAANVCAGCAVNWSNGQSGTSITVSAPGTYTATVSNNCGQSLASNAITVTAGLAPNAPAISASGPTSLCGNETVTLTAANVCAGCPVNWSNGQSGTSITVSAPGTYTATVNNNCGPSLASNAIAVTAGLAPNAPAISASGPTSLCGSETVTLTAANVCAGCMVNWSNGQNGTSITVSAPGTYTAKVSNNCGQSLASNAIAVTAGLAPSAPAISASGPTSLCGSETVTLKAANVCAGCSVTWSNNQSGDSITVSAPGTYTAKVSNNCGQSQASNAITVTTNPPFLPVLQVNNLCHLAAPTGSAYQWSVNGSAIPGATGQFWSAQVTGYYLVSMKSPAGCPGTSDPIFAEACVSSVQNASGNLTVNLYPNPAQDKVYADIRAIRAATARLDLFTADGRYVGQLFQGDILPGGQILDIALPELPAGLYRYRLITELGSVNGNLVVMQR